MSMRTLIVVLISSPFLFAQYYPPSGGGSGGTCAGLGGDVTGTCAANTAVKVNNGSLPLTAALVATDSSGRIILAAPFLLNGQTATYQVTLADFNSFKTIVVPSGTFNVTLVAQATQPANGRFIKIINYGTGSVTVVRSGQTINGGTGALTLPAASSPTLPSFAFFTSDSSDYYGYVGGNPAIVPAQIFSFGAGFTNAGGAIAATIGLPVTAASACTIRAWSLSIPAADTGTVTVKFLKIAAGTSSPAIGNSINTSGVSLSSGTHIRSTTLTDFTSLIVSQGDIIAADLITVGGSPTGLTASLECQ